MEEERKYKTPSYQRKAYLSYLERNKNNEEFLNKRRQKQKEYYQKNKEKILARIKAKKVTQN
jgi:hypothetical protein